MSTVQQLLKGVLFTSLVVFSRAGRPLLLLEIVMLGIGVRGLPLLLAARPLWWRMTCLMYPLMAGAEPESGEAINPATAPPLFSPLRRCRLLHSHILPRLFYLRSQFEKRGRLADSPVRDKLKSITRPVHRLRNNRSPDKGFWGLRFVSSRPFLFLVGCQLFKQSSTCKWEAINPLLQAFKHTFYIRTTHAILSNQIHNGNSCLLTAHISQTAYLCSSLCSVQGNNKMLTAKSVENYIQQLHNMTNKGIIKIEKHILCNIYFAMVCNICNLKITIHVGRIWQPI